MGKPPGTLGQAPASWISLLEEVPRYADPRPLASGHVVACQARLLNMEVVLKVVLRPSRASNHPLREFIECALSAGQLRSGHPGFVPMLDLLAPKGHLVSVSTSLLPARPLQGILPNLSPPSLLRLITAVADALDYLHAFNAAHGDVSQRNILLDKNGVVHLVDFDFAPLPPYLCRPPTDPTVSS